jgi:predicted ester cyclase
MIHGAQLHCAGDGSPASLRNLHPSHTCTMSTLNQPNLSGGAQVQGQGQARTIPITSPGKSAASAGSGSSAQLLSAKPFFAQLGRSPADMPVRFETGTYNHCTNAEEARANIFDCLAPQCELRGLYVNGHVVKGPDVSAAGRKLSAGAVNEEDDRLASLVPPRRWSTAAAITTSLLYGYRYQTGTARGRHSHPPITAPPPPLAQDYFELYKSLKSTFPDLRVDCSDVMATGEKSFARLRHAGTMSGEWMGLPATNKRLEFDIWAVLTVRGGKIVDGDMVWDSAHLLESLGKADSLPVPGLRNWGGGGLLGGLVGSFKHALGLGGSGEKEQAGGQAQAQGQQPSR